MEADIMVPSTEAFGARSMRFISGEAPQVNTNNSREKPALGLFRPIPYRLRSGLHEPCCLERSQAISSCR
jgi:hypothetical protein